MTDWRIQRCPNVPGSNEDDNAFLSDSSGPMAGEFHLADLIGGWAEGWDYIGGNAEPGDTVIVLEPDTRTAEELGCQESPHGWSPYCGHPRHEPLSRDELLRRGWEEIGGRPE